MSTEETTNKITVAYDAYNNDTRHEALTIRLKSGLYFKTVRLYNDLQSVYGTDIVVNSKKSKNGYSISVNKKVVDYITEIK